MLSISWKKLFAGYYLTKTNTVFFRKDVGILTLLFQRFFRNELASLGFAFSGYLTSKSLREIGNTQKCVTEAKDFIGEQLP